MAAEASFSLASASSPLATAPRTQWSRWSSNRPRATDSERAGHGRDLGEDVDAVLLLLDHLLQPKSLPFDATKPAQILLLAADVSVMAALDIADLPAGVASSTAGIVAGQVLFVVGRLVQHRTSSVTHSYPGQVHGRTRLRYPQRLCVTRRHTRARVPYDGSSSPSERIDDKCSPPHRTIETPDQDAFTGATTKLSPPPYPAGAQVLGVSFTGAWRLSTPLVDNSTGPTRRHAEDARTLAEPSPSRPSHGRDNDHCQCRCLRCP
jgi:hypothetical protein